MQILLIEDNKTDQRLFDAFLARASLDHNENYSAIMASNALEASSELSQKQFDIIFLDDRLTPNTSSVDTFEQIGALIGSTPVIVISSCVDATYLHNHCGGRAREVVDKLDLFEKLPTLLQQAH